MELGLKSTFLTDHPKPSTSSFILYYHFLMIGAGLMIAWGTLSTAFDWIFFKFPSKDASTLLTFALAVPNVGMQPLTLIYGHLFSFNTKIITSFVAMGVLLLVTPFFVEYTTVGYPLLVFVTAGIGVFNALSQVAVFGLAGTMPSRYTSAVMSGNSFGGVAICVARMVCLWVLGSDEQSLLTSTVVYFSLGGVTLGLCVLSQYLLMKDSLVVECVAKAMGGKGDKESQSFFCVFREVWECALFAFSTFLITYAVFPTVTLATTSE